MVTSQEKIAFVGLGRMGLQMARHLLDAGHDVTGVDSSRVAGRRFADLGGRAITDLRGVADASVVLSSLPGTPESIAVYSELFGHLQAGTLCIDLSTVSVAASQSLSTMAAESDVDFVDAPVSGTSTHAASGTLVVMIGGSRDAFARCRPYVAPFASTIHHCGGPGTGLELKLITNRLLTAHLGALAEAIVEIEHAGLDVDDSLEILQSGAVPKLLGYKARPMAARDHTPLFTVDLMRKDLRLADERRPAGAVMAAGAELIRAAAEAGFGDSDISAVIEMCLQSSDGGGNDSGQ